MNTALRMFGTAALALLCAAPTAKAQNVYTWTGTEATMSQRLTRNGTASVAGTAKTFPGTTADNVRYTTFSFTNTSGTNQTFFAEMLGETGGFSPFFSAYLAAFNPLNLSSGYLGDAGSSCAGTSCSVSTRFFVDVLAGQTVVLVANSSNNNLPTAGATFRWNAGFGSPSVVPEPSTYALMATGLIGLTGVVRRRRRRTAGIAA